MQLAIVLKPPSPPLPALLPSHPIAANISRFPLALLSLRVTVQFSAYRAKTINTINSFTQEQHQMFVFSRCTPQKNAPAFADVRTVFATVLQKTESSSNAPGSLALKIKTIYLLMQPISFIFLYINTVLKICGKYKITGKMLLLQICSMTHQSNAADTDFLLLSQSHFPIKLGDQTSNIDKFV